MLQAVAHDRPVLFLPLTALGRHQHQTLISTEQLSVEDLPGRTVGVRAWSQTTGMWVRGFLAHQYNQDLRSVRWRTYEGGHIPEQAEPSWVERAEEGASLANDLLEGRVDFAVMGNDRPDDPRVHSVIVRPATASGNGRRKSAMFRSTTSSPCARAPLVNWGAVLRDV
jgi:4,5-dihydroxyphthalate decarboxylase